MLEHYGRIQESDYDKIAEACRQIKQEKERSMGDREPNSAANLTQNEDFTLDIQASAPSFTVAQKAAQHTAVGGGIE
jgi:hypothetical protein